MALVLTATTDKFEVVTAGAAIDVHSYAAFDDLNAGAVTPGTQGAAISTATTTTVVSAPAASTYRQVNFLSLRNRHATAPVDVTFVWDNNSTDRELHKVTLRAGEMLQYSIATGFITITSQYLGVTLVKLGSDQSNSTTTLTEVTGMSQTTGVGTFMFRYNVLYQAGATTTGVRFSVNHTGTLTAFVANVYWATAVDAAGTAINAPDQDVVTANAGLPGYFAARAKSTTGWGTTLSVDTANADMLTVIEGLMIVTADGDIELWHGSEVAAASTVKAGSSLMLARTGG